MIIGTRVSSPPVSRIDTVLWFPAPTRTMAPIATFAAYTHESTTVSPMCTSPVLVFFFCYSFCCVSCACCALCLVPYALCLVPCPLSLVPFPFSLVPCPLSFIPCPFSLFPFLFAFFFCLFLFFFALFLPFFVLSAFFLQLLQFLPFCHFALCLFPFAPLAPLLLSPRAHPGPFASASFFYSAFFYSAFFYFAFFLLCHSLFCHFLLLPFFIVPFPQGGRLSLGSFRLSKLGMSLPFGSLSVGMGPFGRSGGSKFRCGSQISALFLV